MTEEAAKLVTCAKFDRFSAIFPESLEKEVLSNLDELARNIQVTCILIHKTCKSPTKFYHATYSKNVYTIMKEGLKTFPQKIDNSSFGSDLIYTFRDKWRLNGAESIIEVTYQGDYFESVAEMDKPMIAQHACGLFPDSILSIREVLPYSDIVSLMIGTNERVLAEMKNKVFNELVWASNNLETVAHYYEGCVVLLVVELLPEEAMLYVKGTAYKPAHYSWGVVLTSTPKDALWYSFSAEYLQEHTLFVHEVFPDLSKYQEKE